MKKKKIRPSEAFEKSCKKCSCWVNDGGDEFVCNAGDEAEKYCILGFMDRKCILKSEIAHEILKSRDPTICNCGPED